MKKLLFIVVMTFMCSLTYAQIKVQNSFANDLIIIGNLSMGKAINVIGGTNTRAAEHKLYCRIFKDKVTYGILVDTENRFDDDFEFALGTDIEKARESINTILMFMKDNPLKTSMTVTDEDNRVIQLNLVNRKTISLDALSANGATICNKVILLQSNLQRALKLLDNKAEEKVLQAQIRNNKM